MKWIPVVTLLILSQNAQCQSYLLLKKRNKVKAVFEVGDKIKIKLEGEEFYTHQMITGFGNDMIRFHYFDVPLSQIEEVKLVEKSARGFNSRALSSKLISAGVIYLLADQFNQVIIRDEPAGISRSTIIVSGCFVTTGLLLKLFDKKRFKINNTKFRLEIEDYLP